MTEQKQTEETSYDTNTLSKYKNVYRYQVNKDNDIHKEMNYIVLNKWVE